MAIAYSFYIKEKQVISELLEIFLNEKNIEYTKEISKENICFNLYHIWGFLIYISLHERKFFDYQSGSSSFEYEWGDCTCISFDFNKFFDNTQAKIYMLDSVIIILKEILNVDAVLLFNNDSLIFRRKNSVISYNKENSFWDSSEFILKMKELE